MNEKEVYRDKEKFVPVGTTDILYDDNLIRNSPALSVMVTAESDLASLTDYPAGTLAYTAGFKAMWQLGADGNWVSML